MTVRHALTASFRVLALLWILCVLGAARTALSEAQTPPIPQLAQWQSQMLTYGQKHCTALQGLRNGSIDSALNAVYYDGARVFYQIADYTGDQKWTQCALDAVAVYRDRYVLPNGGSVPGYWSFTRGLRMHFERTGDPRSREAVDLLRRRSAFGANSDTQFEAWTKGIENIREISYQLDAHLDAEAIGFAPLPRHAQLVTRLLEYVEIYLDKSRWGTTQIAPFMVGLMGEALIAEYEKSKDPRIVPALKRVADFLWVDGWLPDKQAVMYAQNGHTASGGNWVARGGVAIDLNLLIAPLYAFLWDETGEARYGEQGDAIFAAGAKNGPNAIYQAKHFNQHFRWSFDYVKWRGGAPGTSPSPPTPTPSPPALPTPATVTFTGPANGSTVQDTVAIGTVSSSPVTNVKLALNGMQVAVLNGRSASYSWNTKSESNGSHTWKATAIDPSGQTLATATLTLVVKNNAPVPPPPPPPPPPARDPNPTSPRDAIAPTVKLLQPTTTNGVSNGKWETALATASDNVGVSRVDFYFQGTRRCQVTAAPYVCKVSAPASSAHSKIFVWQARAYDAAGNVGHARPVIVVAPRKR